MRGMGRPGLLAGVLLLAILTTTAAAKTRPAPDFALRDLNGKKVELSEIIGDGPVLVSLWALWCRPCLEEMPHLDALHEEFKDAGLQVLAVSQDSPRSQNKVKSFVRSRDYGFRVLLDPNGDLTRSFKTKVIPYTVIVDSDGEIVHARAGYRKGQEKELRKIIAGLLSTPAEDADAHGDAVHSD